MTQTQEPPKPVNPIDVILKKAGLEKLTDVPVALFFVWGKATEEIPNRLWEVDQPVPLEISRGKDKLAFSALTIAFMFQSETEVRVYAVDKSSEPSTVPHRFTLPKNFISPFIEMFPNSNVFINEVAAEFEALSLGPPALVAEEDDEDLEGEEEDDEEEEDR
jgi:hypothetical protein